MKKMILALVTALVLFGATPAHAGTASCTPMADTGMVVTRTYGSPSTWTVTLWSNRSDVNVTGIKFNGSIVALLSTKYVKRTITYNASDLRQVVGYWMLYPKGGGAWEYSCTRWA